MRSKTLTPLLQMSNWLGIEPYKFNGINKTGRSGGSQKCLCYLQETWQSKEGWTRNDVIGMLNYAEQVFLWEVGEYAAKFQVSNERVNYGQYMSKKTMVNNNNEYKSVEIKHPYKLQEFGKLTLQYVGIAELSRDDGLGNPNDFFTFTFPLPPDKVNSLSQIRVYFTESDGGYIGELDIYNNMDLEIRPLRYSRIDSDTLYFNEPAYLFKKPELDAEDGCVEHVLDTYVEEVAVYYTFIDKCEQGQFVYSSPNCEDANCDETFTNLCLERRLVGSSYWAVPKPFDCTMDDDGYHYSKYCLHAFPKAVELNYLTGFNNKTSGEMNDESFSIISKLSLGLADCVREWCECDDCAIKKINFYRQILKEKIENADTTAKGVGTRYQVIVTPQTMELVGGYPVYLGLSIAFQEMRNLKIRNIEGGF